MIAGQSVKVCLCGSRTATVLFCIKPRKLGHIGVQVKAESLPENVCKSWQEFESNVTAIDIVRRKLLVEVIFVKLLCILLKYKLKTSK